MEESTTWLRSTLWGIVCGSLICGFVSLILKLVGWWMGNTKSFQNFIVLKKGGKYLKHVNCICIPVTQKNSGMGTVRDLKTFFMALHTTVTLLRGPTKQLRDPPQVKLPQTISY